MITDTSLNQYETLIYSSQKHLSGYKQTYIRHILPEENFMTGLGIVIACVLETVASVPWRLTRESDCGCLFCSFTPVALRPPCVRCDVTAVFKYPELPPAIV